MPSFALEHAQGSGRPEQCSNSRDMLTIHRYKQSIHSIFLFDTGCPQGDVCRISGALSGLPAAILVHGSCHRTYYCAPGPLDAVHRTRDGHRPCLRHPYGGSVGAQRSQAFGGHRPVPHAPPMAFSGLPYVIQLSVWMVNTPAGQLS